MAKILVADDNSNIQKMVGLALKDQGIDVVAVGNGEAAVRKISDVHPDLVLADVFMPVRNGYEVCRYVKEDSALSHIPVILLVGAFDPLDEQEAQRVGADGVLKKPFVPPDPLISMVKSALTRAGVSLAPAAAPSAEKTASPNRTGADILSGGAGAKFPPSPAQKMPEAAPEPLEEFPAPLAAVKIPEGHGPLAFGNLLNSTETEEEPPVLSSKPMINIAETHEWDEPKDVPEEEDQEDAEHRSGGWHPRGLEEVEEQATPSNSVPDWRDEAFHGSSPAHRPSPMHWAPTVEKPASVEAAQAPSIAVSTLDSKPGASPFTSDAWAAAMAAGVQEKLAQRDAKTLAPDVPEVEASVPVEERSPFPAPTYTPASPEILPAASTQLLQEEKAAEPGNWSAVPEASWEAQAKRAAMLASTWDVATTRSPEETQDVPTYTSEQSSAERTTLESPDNAPSAYSGHWEHEHEPSPSSATPKHEEIHEPARESTLPKSWENAWQTPPSVNASAPIQPNVAHETPAEPAPEVQRIFETPAAQEYVHEPMSAPIVEPEPAPEPAATAAAPNMDELVARVLGKMNPEVLQKVTREILKPVIEAIVRDELESKK